MGLVHLGFVTSYLSRPLVSGFTTGAAFIVFTSQVKHFFGMQPPRYVGALALPKVSPNFVIFAFINYLASWYTKFDVFTKNKKLKTDRKTSFLL